MSERSELDYNENIMFDGILTRIVGKANIIIEDPRELDILKRLAKNEPDRLKQYGLTLEGNLLKVGQHAVPPDGNCTPLDYARTGLCCGLVNLKYTGDKTTDERCKLLAGIIKKVMPEKLHRFIEMSQDMAWGGFGHAEIPEHLLMGMKMELLEFIAKL